MGFNSCGNILNGSEHKLHTTRTTYGNVAIFKQNLHHHVHVTGVTVSHARSSRSELRGGSTNPNAYNHFLMTATEAKCIAQCHPNCKKSGLRLESNQRPWGF